MITRTETASAAARGRTLVRLAQAMIWAFVPGGALLAQTTPPFESATTLSSDVQPIERDFDIPQSGSGQYKLTLTDLGALLPTPAALDAELVVITRGRTLVAQLDGKADRQTPSAVDTLTFDATPGTYTVHIVGKPGSVLGSGPVGVKIANVANPTSVVLDLSDTLSPPQTTPSALSTYQTTFDVAADGDYEMVLADLAFPHADALKGTVLVFPEGGTSLTACLSIPEALPLCPKTKTATLTAGRYQVVVAGALNDNEPAGVFAVRIKSAADGTVVHSRTLPLGSVKRLTDDSSQLAAGNYTLSLKDLLLPAALSQGTAIVTTNASATASVDLVTTEKAFTVAANTPYDVFAYAAPDATAAAGIYDVEVKPATGAAVLSSVQAVGDSSGTPAAYVFPVDITAAGTYRAKFGDFQFPSALRSARLVIVQNGVVAGSTDAGASSTSLSLDAPLAIGRATVVVIVKPATTNGSLTQAGGTFGLEMSVVGGTQSVLDATQGIGGLINVRKISITQAGKYDITIADLAAPYAFNDLMMVISRGSQKLGQLVVGSGGSNPQGGTVTLPDVDTTAGNYSITLIALPGTASGTAQTGAAHASTYGIAMASSPPAPTVTLSATPASVAAGATAGLTWSSQGATSCTASSTPAGVWSGSKGTSGTDASGPISVSTTFTLRCLDSAGRATEKTATVDIAAKDTSGGGDGGGGGAFDGLTLATLALGAIARRACRRPMPASAGH